MNSEDCDHLLLYVTSVSGLEAQGLFWRCRDCFNYWPMETEKKPVCPRCGCEPHHGFCTECGCLDNWEEPDHWGYNSNGDVVDLR